MCIYLSVCVHLCLHMCERSCGGVHENVCVMCVWYVCAHESVCVCLSLCVCTLVLVYV